MLCRLDLAGCVGIKDEGMQALAEMQHLQALNINQCKYVSDAGAAVLATSVSIRDVFLLTTNISQHGLQLLQDALGLQPTTMSPCHLLRST